MSDKTDLYSSIKNIIIRDKASHLPGNEIDDLTDDLYDLLLKASDKRLAEFQSKLMQANRDTSASLENQLNQLRDKCVALEDEKNQLRKQLSGTCRDSVVAKLEHKYAKAKEDIATLKKVLAIYVKNDD
jgi:chromosome segregation ATPase